MLISKNKNPFKKISVIMIFTLLLGVFSGCKKTGDDSIFVPNDTKDKITIVTTIFPEYDWVRNIIGEEKINTDFDITLLLDDGVDLHSFSPTVDDIIKISSCDIFIYVGGESDEWVRDALSEAVNKDMIVLSLLDIIKDNAYEEEDLPGIEEEDTGDEEEMEYDEHVWLSLRNAKTFVSEIEKAIEKKDEKNKDIYEKNADAYIKKLEELDESYKETILSKDKDTLVFGDRFPFRYMTEDYGLSYYAAFSGCSAETEASFKTITFLSEKIDELSLSFVIKIDGSDEKIAKTVAEYTKNKDIKILTLDSMQSVKKSDLLSASYLSVMENNLNVLDKALD